MTPETQKLVDRLIKDCHQSQFVKPWQAVQAVLLGAIQMDMRTDETKEVLDIIRQEFGMERKAFAEMVTVIIQKMPPELKQGRLERPIHWDV